MKSLKEREKGVAQWLEYKLEKFTAKVQFLFPAIGVF